MARRRSRREAVQLSDAEWRVMQAVWARHAEAGRAVTAREIAGSLSEGRAWAYTTVKTLLGRLAAKGAVTERRVGPAAVYEPTLSRAEARRTAVRSLLDRAFGGSFAPFAQFLATDARLDAQERAELREMVERMQRRRAGGADE